jgi:hypothetical protein
VLLVISRLHLSRRLLATEVPLQRAPAELLLQMAASYSVKTTAAVYYPSVQAKHSSTFLGLVQQTYFEESEYLTVASSAPAQNS